MSISDLKFVIMLWYWPVTDEAANCNLPNTKKKSDGCVWNRRINPGQLQPHKRQRLSPDRTHSVDNWWIIETGLCLFVRERERERGDYWGCRCTTLFIDRSKSNRFGVFLVWFFDELNLFFEWNLGNSHRICEWNDLNWNRAIENRVEIDWISKEMTEIDWGCTKIGWNSAEIDWISKKMIEIDWKCTKIG